jgi:prepilin-type N-terminal cleavage/methylation domain-containing protein
MKTALLGKGKISGLCAFTLTELVVVSSIIAVLMAILVPSLSKTKSEALRILCANNEKQIGLALQLYLQENGKYICFAQVPKFSYQPGDRTVFWDYRILAYNLTTNSFFCPGKARKSSLTNWFAYDGLNECLYDVQCGLTGTGEGRSNVSLEATK